MAWIDDILLELTKSLYPPDARAFLIEPDGVFEKVHKALAVSEAQAYNDAVAILNSIIPDNDNFTEYDATQWERRLAIIGNDDIPLADRKLAILQKMAYPGIEAAPRQAATFLQTQLRAAGYDVYVYENRFYEGSPAAWITKTPAEVLAGTTTALKAMYGFVQYGQVQYGQDSAENVTMCVNYLEEDLDALFDIGDNYRSTFFIAGATIDTFADVDATRKENFRQLILQLKPAQTVAYLFINYI